MKRLNLAQISFGMKTIVFLMALFSFNSFAQVPGVIRCHTVHMDSVRHANNPDLQTNEEFEAWIAKELEAKRKAGETQLIINGVYQIPVVVHVIHNGEAVGTGTNISAAIIQSQIDVLNEDFRKLFGTNGWNTHPDGADTKIEFCLARRRPDGTAFPAGEDGINRVNRNTQGWGAPPYTTAFIDGTIKPWSTGTDLGGWDPADYMNFWSINISGGILGYAQFPTTVLGGMGCGAQSTTTDGVVMLYSSIGKSAVSGYPGPYNEGRTATHEIGHWLGLRHIWGDGGCGVDDYCADTPLSDASNFGCPTTNSCTDPNGDPNDMVENYMDYTDDLCMNIFTYDQMARMRIVLENSPIRASLITSDACIPPAVSDASIINISSPAGDNCPGSLTPNVTIKNRGSSTLTSATIEYTIDGGTPTSFAWTGSVAAGGQTTVNLPAFTALLGVHTIKAYSLLPNGVIDPDPTYDTTELQFAVSNGYQPDYLQDFESGTFTPDVRWNVVNPNGDCYQWIGQSCTSSTGGFPNDAAMMPNFNNGTNQDEYLYTPIFILPCNATSANLLFDKAYKKRVNGSNDRLRVEISEDCGATWNATPIFDQSGNALVTSAGNLSAYWIPSSAADWGSVNIDLMPFVTSSSKNVQFRFRATNAGNGGNLYVDNFEFTAVTPGEIELTVAGTDVLDGGFYNAGSQPVGGPTTITFTIDNPGTSNLVLTGPISVVGDAEFVLNTSFGTTTVPAGGSTTFSIDFTPTGSGPFSATVSFGTNDCDEAAYDFEIFGTGNVSPPVAVFTANPTVLCEGSTVTYTDASTGASTWAWTFPGGTPASATGAGPHVVTYNTAGTYNAQLDVTNAYGSDTDLQTNLITVISSTGTALPITEGFVAATFPPAGWSINNGGLADTWYRSGTQGTAPTAGNSAIINNYTNNTSGNIDDLVMIPADFTGLTSAQLQFDVAYARYNATYFDQLQVLVSDDCGATYTIVYDKAGTVLATDPDQTGGYTAPATWRQETIDLTAYVGAGKVDVLFRSISGWGQYLYVDNINLTGVVATEIASFTAAPNPICEGETVTFTDASTGATSWDWNFGAGATPATATGAGPHVVTYSTAGTPSVTLTINGGTDTDVQSITVNAVPSAPVVTVTDNCGSSDLIASGTNLLWSTAETTSTITVTTSGTYTVTQTSVAGCVSPSGSGVANPIAIPSAPVVTVIDNCGSSDLTATGTNLLWSTGETTSTITVVAAGPYTVTQTVGGCTSAPGTGVANPIAIPSAPVVTVTDNCGSSDLTATGTNLLWSTGETTSTITVLTAGSYTVTQTVGGCTSAPGTGVANPTAIPSAPVVTVTDNCGSTDLTATGSNLLWSTGETTATITVVTAGTYTVTQTVGGCTSAAGSGVANPLAVPSAPVVTVVDNCGSSDLTATGTNLLWSTGETTATITVVTAGAYTVTQTVGGCISNPGTGVANPIAIPSAPVVTVSDNCGSTDLTATGTNLLWSTGETTATITVLAAGTYTVTQTVGGCTSSPGSGVANPLAVPSAPVVTVVDNCGSSDLTATGTNLLWSTGETTSTITVGTAGTYTVTQTVGGCTSSAGSGVANPIAIPSAPVVTVTDNCGSSDLTATGTNLLWSTGETTATITVVTAGPYTVTQTVGGCTSAPGTGNANPIAIPSAPVVTVVDNCGSSDLTATGTNLLWSTGETTSTITVTTAGIYTVTQTVSGCTSSAGSGGANPLPTPTISLGTQTNPSACGASDGSIVINGSGAGDIGWTGPVTGSAIGVTLPYTITGLSAGGYSITFVQGGCPSNILNGSLADPSAPAAPVVTVTDNCGSSDLTATGTNLLWSTGETTATITVTMAGSYTVTQTVGGCTSAPGTGNANPIAIPSAPVVTVTDNCGSSDLTATGINLLWSTGETTTTITVATAGTYTVTQTVGGCTSSAGSGVASPLTSTTITLGSQTSPSSCGATDGSIVVNGSGTGDVTWTGTASGTALGVTLPYTITGLGAGSYNITFSYTGCTSNALNGSLSDPSAPSAPVVTVIDNCGSSDLTATGTNLVWSTAETTSTITVGTAGTYTVTQTVAGCTSAPGTGVANPIAIPSSPTVTVVDNCGSSDLTATGTNLLWSTGETSATITVMTAGAYTVTQTVGGCTSAPGTGNANPIAIPAAPVVTVIDNCGSSDLTAAGTNLLWSTGETTPTITVTTAGIYTVTQTVGGCTSATGAGGANPIPIPFSPVVTVTDNCGNSVLTATGSNLLWSTGETTASITVGAAGTYTVTQTIGGCTSSPATGVANPGTAVTPTINPTGPIALCAGQTVDLVASQGTNIVWSTGETTQTITVGATGSYTVTYDDGMGCSATSLPTVVVVILNPAPPVITANGSASLCTGETVDLMSSYVSGNIWSTTETTQSINVGTAGTYTVTYTDGNGCSSTSSPFTVIMNTAPSAPVITANGPTTFCDGGSVDLTSSQATGNEWSTTETTQTITVIASGTYTVTYTDANGCSATSSPTDVIVNALPNVSMPTLADVCREDASFTLTGATPLGGVYSGPGVTGGVFDPAIAGVGIHTITYSYTDGNGCTGTDQTTIQVDDCSGLEELMNGFVTLYPNPASSQVTITSSIESIDNVTIYDNAGRLVYQSSLTGTETIIDISEFAPGVYNFEVYTNSGVTRLRLMKQ